MRKKRKEEESVFGPTAFGARVELKKEKFIVKKTFFPDDEKDLNLNYVVNANFKRWFVYKEEHFEEATSEIIYARDVICQKECGSVINELSRAIINLKEIDLLRELNLLSKTQINRFLTTDQSMLVRIIDLSWVDGRWQLEAQKIFRTTWPIGTRAYLR